GAVYAVTGVGFLSKSTGSAEDWRSVGLDNRIVTELAIAPTSPLTLYAGGTVAFAAYPELHRSTDGGRSWKFLVVPSPSRGTVLALAVDPSNALTVYAATSYGVEKSTDRGETWSAMNAGLPNMDVVRLAVAPSTGLYAGTYGRGAFETSLPRATAGSVLKSYLESVRRARSRQGLKGNSAVPRTSS